MAWMVLAESAGLSWLVLGGLTFMVEGVFGRSSDSSITVWTLKQAKCFGYPGPKKNGKDKLYGGVVEIDENAREEYWRDVRGLPERVADCSYRS